MLIKKILILILLSSASACSYVTVQQAEQDTVFVWLASCGLMGTCYGYQDALESALQDNEITYDEYYELKRIYDKGYIDYYKR